MLNPFDEPEWAAAVVSTMAWIYDNHAGGKNYRKHQSLIGHSFSDWANTELLARSQRRVREFQVINNGTWKHIDQLNKNVLRKWATRLDLREKYDYFEQNHTSEGAIGDAYETTCLRLAVGRNMTAYWNLIEYAFFTMDRYQFDEQQALALLSRARNWS